MTTANPCNGLVEGYLSQLSNDFEVSRFGDRCYIATPFTRPDGEVIEFGAVTLSNGQTRLSDMGDTLGYLYVNGLTLTRSLIDKVREITRGYGVIVDRNAIVATVDPIAIGEDLHKLIHACLAVASLIFGGRSSARVMFNDEVESFVIQTGVTYDSDFDVLGARERHSFKFHVDSGANLLIQPLSAATESGAHAAAQRWAFRAIDVTQNNPNWKPIIVLDDRNSRRGVWTPEAQAPIGEFAVPWENRERLAELLSSAVPY